MKKLFRYTWRFDGRPFGISNEIEYIRLVTADYFIICRDEPVRKFEFHQQTGLGSVEVWTDDEPEYFPQSIQIITGFPTALEPSLIELKVEEVQEIPHDWKYWNIRKKTSVGKVTYMENVQVFARELLPAIISDDSDDSIAILQTAVDRHSGPPMILPWNFEACTLEELEVPSSIMKVSYEEAGFLSMIDQQIIDALY